jgi:Holliday junction resolvase RusA-like endonuclease
MAQQNEQEVICASCGSAACAAGDLMCEQARAASLAFRKAAPWPSFDDQLAAQSWPQAPLFPAGYPVAMVVYGDPEPQGSKTPIYRGKGAARQMIGMREAAGHALARWRTAIIAQCEITMAGREPLDGPLRAAVTFSQACPAKPRKGSAARTWPEAPAGTDDLDKLLRAVGDALQIGKVIANDARITGYDRLEKVWAGSGEVDALDRPGVVIRVRRR